MPLRICAESIAVPRDAVMDHAGAVRYRDSGRLCLRDRRHWQVGKAREEQRPVEFVHSPVHRGQAVPAALPEEGRVGELAVAMHDVEVVEPQTQGFPLQGVEGRRDAWRDTSVVAFQS